MEWGEGGIVRAFPHLESNETQAEQLSHVHAYRATGGLLQMTNWTVLLHARGVLPNVVHLLSSPQRISISGCKQKEGKKKKCLKNHLPKGFCDIQHVFPLGKLRHRIVTCKSSTDQGRTLTFPPSFLISLLPRKGVSLDSLAELVICG